MPLSLSALFLFLLGCAAAPARPAAPLAPLAPLEYRLEVPAGMPAAQSFGATLRLPAEVRALEARLLVGNAAVTLPLESGPGQLRRPYADLDWDARERILEVASRGKPFELVLRLEGPLAPARDELEQSLVRGTSTRADGQPRADFRARLVERPGPPAQE